MVSTDVKARQKMKKKNFDTLKRMRHFSFEHHPYPVTKSSQSNQIQWIYTSNWNKIMVIVRALSLGMKIITNECRSK